MLPSTTYRRAAEAEYALGRLDATARQLVAPHGLVRSTQLRDAQSSASLDGVYLSLKEVLVADLLTSQDSVRHSDLLRRITPYLQAYRHGHRCVRAGAAIDAALMSELNGIMTGRTDTLRTDRGVLTNRTAEPYLLTAAGPHLLDRLEQLTTWAEADTSQPNVAQIAIAHYQLEVLQPFPSANGHVAREFSMLHLVRRDLLHDHILPLSVWLDDNLDEYQKQIHAVIDTGEIHRWVEFFSTAIRDQANAQLALIARLNELATEFTDRAPTSKVFVQVVNDLLGYPVINHRAIQTRGQVSQKYATDVARRLIDLNILTNWQSYRYNQVFFCGPVLNLLNMNAGTRADVQRYPTR